MNKIKRIYYVPGLVSLVLLTLMLLVYIQNKGGFKRYSIVLVDYFIPQFGFAPEGNVDYPKRDYSTLVIGNDIRENNRNVQVIQDKIEKMILEQDSISGINILFDVNAKYESFVQVVSALNQIEYQYWHLKGNNIWIYNMPKVIEPVFEKVVYSNININICGGVYPVVENEAKYLMVLKEVESYKEYLPIFILYLILVVFAVLWCNKFRRVNQVREI